MPPRDAVLLIHTGDLPGLAAAMVRPEPDRLVIWHPAGDDASATRRRAAVEALAGALNVRELVVPRVPSLGHPDGGLAEAAWLLHAVAHAGSLEAARIVWPRQVGPDPARVAEIVDRAEAVCHLARIGGTVVPDVDLPLVDLRDEQVVDLAEDVGAPLTCFWPCDAGGETPCGDCAGCARWQAAFEEAGAAWPWVSVRV